LGVGIAQSLIFSTSFFLTLFQIAVQKGLVGMFKSGLRVLPANTGQPAGNDKAYKERRT